MIARIEIATRDGLPDPRGEHAAEKVRTFLGLPLESLRTRDVYHVVAELEDGEVERILAEFRDPVLHDGAVGRVEDPPYDFAVTVAYKPGVTDPVGKSALVAVTDTLGRELGEGAAVYSSVLWFLAGVDEAGATLIAESLLANSLIQSIRIEPREARLSCEPDLTTPAMPPASVPPVQNMDLSGSDEELQRMSDEGLLALNLEEMKAIRDHFASAFTDSPERKEKGLGAFPTDVELECLAQTWSEHCKHKIFNATITYSEEGGEEQTISSLFNDYIRGSTEAIDAAAREAGGSWLVSVFHDNAGVVAFDDEQHLVFKVETHNSPSALDPYGGAMTGIVGVNRDPFGTGIGAELLSNVWGYCFGSPFHQGELPKGLHHPRRIRDGVHQGVIDGGNQSGVPYARGWEVFDDRYLGKPLVFCGTVGSLPVTVAGKPGEEKAARPGDLIVMVGGRIGADGIHGATFSSAALDESAPVQAVQIGDPITQKIMFDFLVEARDRGLYTAITDNGAGGLSSSVGEMAETPGGAELDLALAPLKYAGLFVWEILLSEAQERMTLSVAPDKIDELLALAAERQTEATVLGHFTAEKVFHVKHGEQTVALLSMDFMHDGDPDLDLTARWEAPQFPEPAGSSTESLGRCLELMMGRLEICSGEKKARHYDHEVKGLSVVRPYIGVKNQVASEASVLLARHGSLRAYVLSEAVNPFLSDIDTKAMAETVLDESVRRQLCAGATLDRIAVLDNFCWPDPVQSAKTPDGEYKLAQLVRACRALSDLTRAYGTPLISGKDSMKNDSTMGGVKISVPPTLLLSAIGQIPDVHEALTLDFKQEGDVIFLLGTSRDETGGSAWFRLRGELEGAEREDGGPAPWVGNKVPGVNPEETLPLYRVFETCVRAGLVRSAATPSKGGLGIALAKSSVAGGLGASVDLAACPHLGGLSADVALFAESNGRFLVSVAAANAERFGAAFERLSCSRLGEVGGDSVRVLSGDEELLSCSLTALETSYQETLSHV